jgi:molecular chaperone GrpE
MRELAQRVQADFENYRKRVLREQTSLVERASEGLVEQLLPVLDSFELALASLDDADHKVSKGVELVHAELLGVLEKAGLERIDALGKPFDPNEHEAVAQEDGEGEPVVFDILRQGYRLKGRVLRPAAVRVTRAEG